MKPNLQVAVAIISNQQGEILLAERAHEKHEGGKWEFSGGKVELGERVEQALIRELQEELGITPTDYRYLFSVQHDYVERSVLLEVYSVFKYLGEAKGIEGQKIQWVARSQLKDYSFPQANQGIIDYLMSDQYTVY